MSTTLEPRIRPVVLAGGLGTRMRPRTEYLPKPLLPVDGRPLLWYALRILRDRRLLPPIVTLDYKAELIHAYFERDNAEFRTLPGRTMAESFLEVAESDAASAFLGVSSDVLIPPAGVEGTLAVYQESGRENTAIFVRLQEAGHKKWQFIIRDGRLTDIVVGSDRSQFERLLLIINATTVRQLRKILGGTIKDATLPESLKPYQSGWTLLLKTMTLNDIPVISRIVDIPVHNINAPEDLDKAQCFVSRHFEV